MGAVETDEQLQQTVDKFLCPVINKLVSPFQSVRDKVSERETVLERGVCEKVASCNKCLRHFLSAHSPNSVFDF